MDPKDWFSNCEECGKRYETKWLDNGLCEDCNKKQLEEELGETNARNI